MISGVLTSSSGASGAAPAPSTAPSPRLVHAAHEFEAQMMKEMLKPMTGSNQLTGEDSDSDSGLGSGSGSGGALGEFASEALGQALSERGGFGIADRIVHDLSHSSHRPGLGKVTGNLHKDTVMRAVE